MIPVVLALLTSSFASSFYTQPFPEIVRGAPAIVRGKVGKSEVQWTTLSDGSRHLFTYYEVDVSEGLKGGPRTGSPIRIRELGGEKDGVSLNVSGTAGFDKGEDIVVMLGDAAQVDGAYPVVGMMMGKFNIEKGEDGKEYLKGAALQAGHTGEKPVSISLDHLREVVRTQAAEPKVTPSIKPKPLAEAGLLSGKTPRNLEERTEIHDDNLGRREATSSSPTRPIVLILGFGIGLVWFLKSRKKRR